MGRKSVPVDLLLVRGNKNLTKAEIEKRKKAEEKLKPNTDNIKPPSWLSPAAKREFRKLVAELQVIDLISNVDVNQLAAYCRSYVRYIDLQKEDNPNEKTLDTLFKQIKSMASEFGMTPSARAKLAMTPPKEDEKPKSKEEEMFGGI